MGQTLKMKFVHLCLYHIFQKLKNKKKKNNKNDNDDRIVKNPGILTSVMMIMNRMKKIFMKMKLFMNPSNSNFIHR